jgi:hypothetical protein
MKKNKGISKNNFIQDYLGDQTKRGKHPCHILLNCLRELSFP